MALAKKGLRKIVVDDQIFYWKIRKIVSHNEKHDNEYGIPVQHESEGQLLLIYTGFCKSIDYGRELMNITPKLIQSKITEAIELGWNYSQPGKTVDLVNGELIKR
ncbi:hypothetical protein [Chryseobacterium sp. JM1]|uniref:hypothetical protein n=1 Tax=Chryseobacterium sp. JM1 TaxID=1233950 RepID=UPI0004E74D66|nr:hypothetical protein [Chryseobacterium sp. JM1]KFF18892.1 hypothetical protein IW22_16970 [Chryseobacterium sp. JM1]